MPSIQHSRTPAEQETYTDSSLLNLLTDPDNPRPWSREELARELGNTVDATDAIRRLCLDGLAHRTSDGFVFATRAAIHYAEIMQ